MTPKYLIIKQCSCIDFWYREHIGKMFLITSEWFGDYIVDVGFGIGKATVYTEDCTTDISEIRKHRLTSLELI